MSSHFPDTPHIYLPASTPISAPNRWVFTPEATQGLRELKSIDKAAWQQLVSGMQRRARTGGKPNDPNLDAPVGQQFTPKLDGPQPWLGELKQEGSELGKKVGEGYPQYRLYFADLEDIKGQPPAQMLAGDCREKWISTKAEDEPEVSNRQDRDMEAAMRTIIYWCKKQNRGYRHAVE